jgi:hypothetical protein
LRSRADATWTTATVVVAGLAFAAFLGASGVPALRHDWAWVAGDGFFSNVWSSLGGWSAAGIGSPRPYPSDYLIAIANLAIVRVLGTYGGFLANAFAVGAVCAAGAAALTRRFTDSRAAAIAAAAFATFNPWVYNKIVAGHVDMILAYGAAMLLLAELSKERPSAFRVGLFLILTMQQIQFFLPALLVVAVWTLVRRESVGPLAVGLLASMPIWIGLTFDRSYLLAIPYTQSWQADASLDPVRALELSGYFVKYADALPWIAGAACWTIVGLALLGATLECIRRPLRAAWLVALALGIWLFVSGTKGPFAGAYLWAVAHVPESGIYRELYDLVGLLAVGYVAASAAAIRRVPLLQWIWLPCGLALAVAWVLAPPARYWVPARDLPAYAVNAPANARYALMPPMQPLVFERGDGLDPDAVVLPGNVVPLNTPQFSFPETPALTQYAFDGDTRWLRSLSVAEIVERPEYRTDLDNLHMQFAVPPKAFRVPGTTRPLDGTPELALTALPELRALPSMPWEDAVFFGDARGVEGPSVPADWRDAPAVRAVAPSWGGTFAADGWVDVRRAFAVLPRLAQGVGGALTTNPTAVLPLDPTLATLAYVDGRLEDAQGRTLATTTHGYAWLAPLGAPSVRCSGLCVVAAQSDGPPPAPARAAARPCGGAVPFSAPAAWLAVGELPASDTCLLRYNVRYDPNWIAFLGGRRLGHVPVDSIVNGWVVPAHAGTQRVVAIEAVACAQFVFMVLAVVVVLGCAATRGYALVKR